MVDVKITDLPIDTDPLITDVMETVSDPGGTPISKQATIANILKALGLVGDVVIGGTTALQRLHVIELDNSGFTGIRIDNPTGVTGSAGIEFSVATEGDYAKAAIYQQRSAAYGRGDLIFVLDPNNDAASWATTDEVMRIQASTGNVTIGAVSTTYTLGVTGTLGVSGELTKGSGSFLIDHPLAPQDKVLKYGFVESPRYDLIHRGTAVLFKGCATVNIDEEYGLTPGTFESLCQSVQVTSLQPVDSFDRVKANKVQGAEFTIECEDTQSGIEVEWVVIGERKDAYIMSADSTDTDGHLINEIEKDTPTPEDLTELDSYSETVETNIEEDVGNIEKVEERVDGLSDKKGYYLHPEAYGETRPTRMKTITKIEVK